MKGKGELIYANDLFNALTKLFIILIVVFLLATAGVSYGVSSLWTRHHREPTAKKSFYSIKADIIILSREDFNKKARWILEKDDVDRVGGLYVRYTDGKEEIYLPKDWAGRIDLESLGHEIFYHCMERE